MNVSEAMHRRADWTSPDTPVAEIARMMAADDIGAVPIGREGQVVGIVTDRDIVLRVIAKGRNPETTPVEDVMSREVICCRTGESVEDAIHLMEQKQVRRLPVIDDRGALVGMLSLGDVAHAVPRSMSGELLHAVAAHHV